WPILDFMHSQNPALGRVQDRRTEKRAVDSSIGNRENSPGQIVELQFSIARFFGVGGDVFLELCKALFIRVSNDRDYQAAFGSNSNTNVVIVVLDQVVAVDSGVNGRNFDQTLDRSFQEKGHEPKFHPMPLLKRLLVLRAQLHNR